MLRDVIFLVWLQEKFEIENLGSEGVKRYERVVPTHTYTVECFHVVTF